MGSSNAVAPLELRRYLLGQLAEGSQERIEARLLAEPDLLESLETAEDDLIEDYLADSLSPEDRASFDGHFLASSRRRESLACARLVRAHYLGAAAKRAPPPVLSWTTGGWLAAAAALILVVWAGSAAWRGDRTRMAGAAPSPGLSAPVAPSPPSSSPESAAPGAPPTSMSPGDGGRPVRVARLTVLAGQTMEGDAEPPALTVPADADRVVLEVVVEGPEAYSELRARVVSSGGRTVQQKTFVKPASVLVLDLPPKAMASGTYTLLLTGQGRTGGPAEEVARRQFTVRHQH